MLGPTLTIERIQGPAGNTVRKRQNSKERSPPESIPLVFFVNLLSDLVDLVFWERRFISRNIKGVKNIVFLQSFRNNIRLFFNNMRILQTPPN